MLWEAENKLRKFKIGKLIKILQTFQVLQVTLNKASFNKCHVRQIMIFNAQTCHVLVPLKYLFQDIVKICEIDCAQY